MSPNYAPTYATGGDIRLYEQPLKDDPDYKLVAQYFDFEELSPALQEAIHNEVYTLYIQREKERVANVKSKHA